MKLKKQKNCFNSNSYDKTHYLEPLFLQLHPETTESFGRRLSSQ